MPVYNGKRFLDEAIQSIRDQTLKDIELIVLDDGSTDESALIAQRNAEQDPRVTLIRLERLGLAGALNEGIRAARAEWIARLDGDDIALPHRLERQHAFIENHPDIGAVGAYGWDIGEHGGAVVGLNRQGPTSSEEFALHRREGILHLLTPTMVFRRDIALEIGGYRSDYSPGEDLDFWNRIADNHTILVIPEPLIYYRIHGAAQTTNQIVYQFRNHARAQINILRRRSGQDEYTQEDLDDLEQKQPGVQRVRQQLAWRSHFYYRRGGSLLAAGRPSGVLWLGVSGLLWPILPIRRLRSQRVIRFAALKLWRRVRELI